MSNLNELSLKEVSHLIQSGTVQPRDLVSDCIASIALCEEELNAFTTFDPERVFDQLTEVERQGNKSALFGIPVGIKDIMETAGMRTTMGSKIYRDHVPQRDAVCVSMLKIAGALVAGKTETTEFAYYYPGRTRNPHALDHTPGGSSMGSAAAVSKMMIPLALGTQTAGSVIRPAAYCGVTGYKASHGSFSLAGVCGFAQSLDTLGFFVRKVEDLTTVRHTLSGAPAEILPLFGRIRAALVKTPHWKMADVNQQQLIEDVCRHLQGHQIEISEIDVGPSDGALTQAQITIMSYEGCRSLSAEYANFPHLLSDQIKALIEQGQQTTYTAYLEAIELGNIWQKKMRSVFEDYDVLITPSAPGEAPRGLDNTGDPIFNRVWTLLKVPCIHLPVAFGPNGLPLGVQLIGAFNQDDHLICIANHIQGILANFEFVPN